MISASPSLAALVANLQDAIIVLDESGQVVFESPSAFGILGATDDNAAAIGIDRIHPDEREAVVRSFERTIAEPGATARATYRFRRHDGTWSHLEAVAKNLLDNRDLRGVLITLRDVTDRIRALEAAERAGAARDEFLSRMSHELRTPLHAILGWAQLLEARDEPRVAEAASQIAAAGHHLLQLVEETLDLAAVREGRISLDLRPVEINSVVADAIEMLRPAAERRDIQLHVDPASPPGATVIADPDRLLQVLLNLLSNAVKYSRYAGDVTVEWHAETPGVRIGIRDSGPGIPADRLDALFERFERLGMEMAGVEGSGLGLAISRRLVEMMRGTIGVECLPGTGAVFWVGLPGLSECGGRPIIDG
jgi:PAS domain S-box-containing protein